MYVETADDLVRKYGETYVLLQGELVYVQTIVQDGREIAAFVTTPDQKEKQVKVQAEDFEELAFPAMYVNDIDESKRKFQVGATLFKRSPRRQWKRGLGHENTIITCPAAPLYRALGKKLDWDHHLTFRLIKHLREPKYPSYPEAVEGIQKHIAMAISPDFAVILSSISPDKHLIASRYGFIGEGNKDTLWIKHHPSEQEITDYVKRTKQNLNIETVNA